MLIRIVRLTFKEEEIETFKQLFEDSKENIKGKEGCLELNLLQQKDQPNIFSTYSIWSGPEALEAYRNSDTFKDVWAKTKILFSDKPVAYSFDRLHQLK